MTVGQMHILGIDVAKAKLDVALLLPDGKFRSEVIANTPEGFEKLAAWLKRNSATQVHACMEATGIYWEAPPPFSRSRAMPSAWPIRPRSARSAPQP